MRLKKGDKNERQRERSGPKNRIQMKAVVEESDAREVVGKGPETRRGMNKRESGIEGEGDPLRH